MSVPYSDVHRFVLRTVASRGILTLPETDDILRKFPDNTQDIEEIVTDINREIRVLQQTIKITRHEVTDEKVFIFLSLGFDGATKSQNFFSAIELEFFRLLLEEIMTTENRQISGIYAMNLVGKMKTSFTKTEAQKVLDTFCRMHYLEKTDIQYALGMRAIHEFESYVRQNLPDTIEECTLCKQIVFRGYNCPTCGVAVHTKCLNRYLVNIQTWPCCKVDYDPSHLQINNTQRQSQSQVTQDTTNEEVSHVDDTAVEPTQGDSDEMDLTLNAPGVSQCVTRKRKRNVVNV